jgi:hypothetical protein
MRSSCHEKKKKTGSLKLPPLFSPHSSRTSSQPIWSCQSITKGNRKKRKKKKEDIQTPKNDAKRDHQTTKQKHIHLGIAKNLQIEVHATKNTGSQKLAHLFNRHSSRTSPQPIGSSQKHHQRKAGGPKKIKSTQTPVFCV